MRWLWAWGLVASVATGMDESRAHGVSLELHHRAAADSVFHARFLLPWAQKVEQEAGGRIRFHPHAASTTGATAEGLYDKVVQGEVDVAWVIAGEAGARFPASQLFELPFLARTAHGASRALVEYVRLRDLAEKEFDGVRILAVHTTDPAVLHMASRSVATAADLAGAKVAVVSDAGAALVQALGATPVRMPGGEIAGALSKSGVDGALLPWEEAAALGVVNAARFHTEPDRKSAGFGTAVGVFVMNGGAFKTMSEDLRAAVDKHSGAEAAATLGRLYDEAAAAARQRAADQGHAIVTLSPEETAKWRKVVQPVADARLEAAKKRGLRVRELMDTATETLGDLDRGK